MTKFALLIAATIALGTRSARRPGSPINEKAGGLDLGAEGTCWSPRSPASRPPSIWKRLHRVRGRGRGRDGWRRRIRHVRDWLARTSTRPACAELVGAGSGVRRRRSRGQEARRASASKVPFLADIRPRPALLSRTARVHGDPGRGRARRCLYRSRQVRAGRSASRPTWCTGWVHGPLDPPCRGRRGRGGSAVAALPVGRVTRAVGRRTRRRPRLDRARADAVRDLAPGARAACAYLFGGVTMLQFHCRAWACRSPASLSMLP